MPAALTAAAVDQLMSSGAVFRLASDPGEVLPLPEALSGLFPGGGLRRGSTITVEGSSSLLLALLAETSKRQGWCAEVGSPLLGSVAALEFGVVLERFVRVAQPREQWPAVVASLVEAFDVVVVHPPPHAREVDMRQLTARARESGAVLVVDGPWVGASVGLSARARRWHGLGLGHGHLCGQEVEVSVLGHGVAARPRTVRLWLPAPSGAIVSSRESVA